MARLSCIGRRGQAPGQSMRDIACLVTSVYLVRTGTESVSTGTNRGSGGNRTLVSWACTCTACTTTVCEVPVRSISCMCMCCHVMAISLPLSQLSPSKPRLHWCIFIWALVVPMRGRRGRQKRGFGFERDPFHLMMESAFFLMACLSALATNGAWKEKKRRRTSSMKKGPVFSFRLFRRRAQFIFSGLCLFVWEDVEKKERVCLGESTRNYTTWQVVIVCLGWAGTSGWMGGVEPVRHENKETKARVVLNWAQRDGRDGRLLSSPLSV